jgi:hypothetical protein
MFRNRILSLLAVVVVLLYSGAHAKAGDKSMGLISGNLTTAGVRPFGTGAVGLFFGFGDESANIFGTVSYAFSNYTEGRAKIGFSDPDMPDSDPELMLGFDFKYKFLDYAGTVKKDPLDMAVGALLEYVSYEGSSIIELGGNLIGSIPYRFQSGRSLVPYGSLNIRLERYSNGDSDSDFRVGLNLGTKYELSDDVDIYGELQIDGNTGLFAGLELKAF